MIQIVFVLTALYFLFISHSISISTGREIALPKTKYFGGVLLLIAISISIIPLPESYDWVVPLASPIIAIVALLFFSESKKVVVQELQQTGVQKSANILTWVILLAVLAGLVWVLAMVLSGK